MRKSLLTTVAVWLCFWMTTPAAAVTQSTAEPAEPTKEQTIDYILARIDDVKLRGGTGSIRTQSKTVKLVEKHVQYATVQDCLLTVRETRVENDVLILEKTVKVPLARLNPADVKVGAKRIYLITADDGFFVDQTVTSRRSAKAESVDRKMTDTVTVFFAKGQGEKLARAFAHLIKLCGGQKDMF